MGESQEAELIFAWLLASGKSIFTAAFIPRITGNFVDKIASCIAVAVFIKKLPHGFIPRDIPYSKRANVVGDFRKHG